MTDLSDRLYDILSSRAFLTMEGLAKEVPIFIQTYDVRDEDRIAQSIHSLALRLRNAGIEVAQIDLFELMLAELEADDLLEAILEEEQSYGRQDLLTTLTNYADAGTKIVPKIVEVMNKGDFQLTFVTGAGHIFPFLRTHHLLESVQPVMMPHPLILFFPGEYRQVTDLGSKLTLFGTQHSKGYYRAFNLDHYRLPRL